MEQEELKHILEENLRLTREIHAAVKSLHRQMVFERVKFLFKLLLLVGVMFAMWLGVRWTLGMLPTLQKNLAPYQDILKLPSQLQSLGDVSKLPKQIQQILSQFITPGGTMPDLTKLPPEIQKLLPQLMSPEKK